MHQTDILGVKNHRLLRLEMHSDEKGRKEDNDETRRNPSRRVVPAISRTSEPGFWMSNIVCVLVMANGKVVIRVPFHSDP